MKPEKRKTYVQNKTTSKVKKQKILCLKKKEMLTSKNRLALFVKRLAWKEN